MQDHFAVKNSIRQKFISRKILSWYLLSSNVSDLNRSHSR